MVDLPSRSNGSKGLAWATVVTPIAIALVSVAVLWGGFSARIDHVEAEQVRYEKWLGDLSGIVVDLRLAVATLTNQVATLNSQLHERDSARPTR